MVSTLVSETWYQMKPTHIKRDLHKRPIKRPSDTDKETRSDSEWKPEIRSESEWKPEMVSPVVRETWYQKETYTCEKTSTQET